MQSRRLCVRVIVDIYRTLGQGSCPSFLNSSPAALSPLSFNASLNSTTLFECTVTEANRPDWWINGLPFESTEIRDRGVRVVSMSIDSIPGAYQSNLSIPATAENNETMIECIAVNFSAPSVRSPVATYLVQGEGGGMWGRQTCMEGTREYMCI